ALHSARSPEAAGLRHSLLRSAGRREPRIRIFVDPSPNVFVARSWMGQGTLYLSQGLLHLLTEQELRDVLRESMLRLDHPALVTSSYGAVLASLMLAKAPRHWALAALSGRPTRPGAAVTLTPG